MTREELIAEIRKETKDNKLECERAYAMAHELGVPLGDIGALCNELKIKIVKCQLGCF
jgi:hypothetical protein